MLTEMKIGEGLQQQLIEKMAMNDEMASALNPVMVLSQDVFENIQKQGENLSASYAQVSQRLDRLDVKPLKQTSNEAFVLAVEEQEMLLEQLEQQFLEKKQSNDDLAASIERLKELNGQLADLFLTYQSQSPETKLSNINDEITKIVQKIDNCQSSINTKAAERLKIDNKVVTLRGRYNQHGHTSNYTLGNYSGSAGGSTGPSL